MGEARRGQRDGAFLSSLQERAQSAQASAGKQQTEATMKDRVRGFATNHVPTFGYRLDYSQMGPQDVHHPTQDSACRLRWIQSQQDEDACQDRNHWMQWTIDEGEDQKQADPTILGDGWFPPRS